MEKLKTDNAYRPDLMFTDAYLFVGMLDEYNESYFTGIPYKNGVITPVPAATFELPF